MEQIFFRNIEKGLINNKNQICFVRKSKGKWQYTKNKEYLEYANNIAYALIEMGIQKGEKVIIISENRQEWNFVDLALLKCGIVSVPLYPTITDDQLVNILNETESRTIFVSNNFLYKKLQSITHKTPTLKYIFTFNKIENVANYNELITFGKNNPQPEKLRTFENKIKPSDVFTILYTSGTSDSIMGVMLSHEAHSVVIENGIINTGISDGYRTILYLPLNYIFGRSITYMAQIKGLTTYYINTFTNIFGLMQDIKPDFFPTVPVLLEKIYDNIQARNKKFSEDNATNQFSINEKKLNEFWRKMFGNNLKVILTGGAKTPKDIISFYNALGISTLNVYGLTETSGLISIDNYKLQPRIGKSGKIIPEIDVKLASDGEILVRGKNVMIGYYKHPEITAETIDEDGWIHTGDIGVIDDNGYIGVIDRKKSAFKNAAGTFVYPEPIEDLLKKSDFIAQAVVTGLNKPYLSALILPDKNFLQTWASNNNLDTNNFEKIINHPEIKTTIQQTINQYNKTKTSKPDMILKNILITDDWSVDTGELTPTMKVKRNFVLNKYKQEIEKLY